MTPVATEQSERDAGTAEHDWDPKKIAGTVTTPRTLHTMPCRAARSARSGVTLRVRNDTPEEKRGNDQGASCAPEELRGVVDP